MMRNRYAVRDVKRHPIC